MNTFTQESLNIFYNESVKKFSEFKEKINTQNELIKKLDDLINKMILEKAITNEKNENLLYKMSIMGDKIIASENKVNELNNIMMKHFAYRSGIIQNPTPPQVQMPTPPQVQMPTPNGNGFIFQNPIISDPMSTSVKPFSFQNPKI